MLVFVIAGPVLGSLILTYSPLTVWETGLFLPIMMAGILLIALAVYAVCTSRKRARIK
jgi:hypothetical protein